MSNTQGALGKYSQISGARRTLMMVALCPSTMCTMGDFVIVPITAKFYELFDEMVANLIATGPALIGIVFCYIGGRLADKVNKKIQMVVGFAIFTFSGILGGLFVNSAYIILMRLLCTGVAWGLTCTAAMAIIAEMYVDETRRSKVIGWYNMVMSLMGAVLSLIAGNLALNGWQSAFKTYLIAIPVLIMLVLFLPNMAPAAAASEQKGTDSASKGWLKPVIPLLILFVLSALAGYIMSYLCALYVTETGIGNEAFIGTLTTAATILSCLCNAAYGAIYGKLKAKTPIPCMVIIAVSFLLLFLFPVKTPVLIVNSIMGGAWGILYSFFYTQITIVVLEDVQGTAIGLLNVANGAAGFAVSYYISVLKFLLHTDPIRATFPLVAIIMAATTVGAVIYVAKYTASKKKSAQ